MRLVHLVYKELLECQEHLEWMSMAQQEHLAHKAPLDFLAQPVQPDNKELQEHRVLLEQRVPAVQLDCRV